MAILVPVSKCIPVVYSIDNAGAQKVKEIKMKQVTMIVGIPCSGKSTWAKEQVDKDPLGTARVSRDDFRHMLSNYTHHPDTEGLVSSLRDHAILTSLRKGFNVIIDETALKSREFGNLKKMLSKAGIDAIVTEKIFYVDWDTAMERNAQRQGVSRVPDDVMDRMWKCSGGSALKQRKARTEVVVSDKFDYTEMAKDFNDTSLPRCALIDLDGTISLFNNYGDNRYPQAHSRNPFDGSTCDKDSPNEPVVGMVHMMAKEGIKIIFCSGREDKYKPQTLAFLREHIDSSVEFDLHMRKSGDVRKDYVIKEEILQANVLGTYRVYVSLDDRNMMVNHYRKMGLNVFQVAKGDF